MAPIQTQMLAIFLFYDKSDVVQSRISPKDFKHVNCVLNDGSGWVLFEHDATGLWYRQYKINDGSALIRNLKRIESLTHLVCVDIGERKKRAWWPWVIDACHQQIIRMCGLDIGWSFTPKGFFKKLIKYNGKTNFDIILRWNRGAGN